MPTDAAHAERSHRTDVAAPSPPLVAALWALAIVAGSIWEPLAPAADWLAQLASTVVIVLGICAVHEAGHLIGGLLVNMPFSRFTLGVVTFTAEERPDGVRLSVGWNRAWLKVAGCVEREIAPGPHAREALTVTALGGPIASTVVGLLLWSCPSPWREFGAISMLIGIVNALPTSCLGQLSDGMIVWRLWSRSPADVAWRAPFAEEAPARTSSPAALSAAGSAPAAR